MLRQYLGKFCSTHEGVFVVDMVVAELSLSLLSTVVVVVVVVVVEYLYSASRSASNALDME